MNGQKNGSTGYGQNTNNTKDQQLPNGSKPKRNDSQQNLSSK